MRTTPFALGSLGILAGLAWPHHGRAQPPTERPAAYVPETPAPRMMPSNRVRPATAIPLGELPPAVRDKAAKVMQHPTITAHGGAEEFRLGVYDWLLDHPDRAAVAWRRLGVPCVDIQPIGQGQFRWSDGEGSELVWSTVWRGDADRIWYGEGHARPSPLLPMVPVRVVAILHYPRLRDRFGVVRVTHEVDVYLQTDSKAAALVTRLIGPAVPRLAEQGANQLLMFFSSLARYCELHPEDVEALLAKQQ